MELEGKIRVVMPAQSGVSQRTGNPWMSQEYVMDYYWFPNQTNPSQIVLRVFGEDRIKNFNLQSNDEVKVRFHCDAHENNGRWYNELRIDDVTFVGASAYKNPQQSQGGTAQQPAADATGTAAQAAPAEGHQATDVQYDENGNPIDPDDLPF